MTTATPSRIPGASAALIAALDARDSFMANGRDGIADDMMRRAFYKVPGRELRACAAAIVASATADAGECLALTLCIDGLHMETGASRGAILASLEGVA